METVPPAKADKTRGFSDVKWGEQASQVMAQVRDRVAVALTLARVEEPPRPRRVDRRTYTCRCEPAWRIRCARQGLAARCVVCGEQFAMVQPAAVAVEAQPVAVWPRKPTRLTVAKYSASSACANRARTAAAKAGSSFAMSAWWSASRRKLRSFSPTR